MFDTGGVGNSNDVERQGSNTVTIKVVDFAVAGKPDIQHCKVTV